MVGGPRGRPCRKARQIREKHLCVFVCVCMYVCVCVYREKHLCVCVCVCVYVYREKHL
jgi:hypothetical protein